MSGYAIAIFIMVIFYTLYMGFNDGSNAIATTVVTRAVQPRTAIILAAALNFVVPIAVFFIGMLSVAGNISGKLFFTDAYFPGISADKAFAFVMSGLIGSIIWGVVTFCLKIPNSTSHTLLGGILGSGMVAFGVQAVQWKEYVLLNVVLMVVLAPVIGLILGYIGMKIVRSLARRSHRGTSLILTLLQRLNVVVLASAFSSNNAQKSLGMFLLIGAVGLMQYKTTPVWVVIAIAGALTLGMLLGGYRVINTVGRKIYKLKPVHSVVAQLTTSVVMLTATSLGISLSTGQIMSSSIMGVGAAERFNGVRWNTALRIVTSWILTLPCSAGMGALLYLLLGKVILGV